MLSRYEKTNIVKNLSENNKMILLSRCLKIKIIMQLNDLHR